MGAKKFGMSLETREIKLFWRDILGFCWDIPAVPEKFEKKKFVFNFRPLYLFHVELRNGLRELTAFAEHKWLAIGDLAHLIGSTQKAPS